MSIAHFESPQKAMKYFVKADIFKATKESALSQPKLNDSGFLAYGQFKLHNILCDF